MAKLILILAAQILLLAITVASAGKNGEDFARRVSRKHLHHGLGKKEKSHISVLLARNFKWSKPKLHHDPSTGSELLNFLIQSFFGSMTMIDNALTSDVPINSIVVGQAQGMYAGADQKELGFLMAMNFAFKTGKHAQWEKHNYSWAERSDVKGL
ncbi:PREDICTED: dirigent protein 3-like [Camelina sativa]|uniref:Dirigent protein n=1 Tax=Camelina sativa TaxID=90675 RepID=A0ABM1QLG6_CAMSA|nr:PREDICTED: dirigent protein 3-like [Camelina sativa]